MDMNIEQFLDLVSNADKYQGKLKELRSYEESIKKAGAQLGDMNQAAAMKAEAEKILENAKKEAQNLLEVAKASEDTRKAVLEKEFQEVQNLRRVAGDVRQQGLDAKVLAETLMKEVEHKEKSLSKERALVVARTEEVAKLKAEYEERLAKLKSVMV